MGWKSSTQTANMYIFSLYIFSVCVYIYNENKTYQKSPDTPWELL